MFFFKQKTAYEMRISDWSSDVCSSDLRVAADAATVHHRGFQADERPIRQRAAVDHREMADQHILADDRREALGAVRHRAVAMNDAAVLNVRSRTDNDKIGRAHV